MDICVYVHVNKIIWGGGGKLDKLGGGGGGACPKSLKTPGLEVSISTTLGFKILVLYRKQNKRYRPSLL